jgi:hypothetical protein
MTGPTPSGGSDLGVGQGRRGAKEGAESVQARGSLVVQEVFLQALVQLPLARQAPVHGPPRPHKLRRDALRVGIRLRDTRGGHEGDARGTRIKQRETRHAARRGLGTHAGARHAGARHAGARHAGARHAGARHAGASPRTH